MKFSPLTSMQINRNTEKLTWLLQLRTIQGINKRRQAFSVSLVRTAELRSTQRISQIFVKGAWGPLLWRNRRWGVKLLKTVTTGSSTSPHLLFRRREGRNPDRLSDILCTGRELCIETHRTWRGCRGSGKLF